MHIVIPAYNEEKTIGPVARDIFSLYPGARVAVVDDGSTDRTAEEAEKAGAEVLRHIFNRGQGAALKTGTDYVLAQGAEIIVHFDADGQFEPKEIGRMIEPVAKGEVEVTLGSRFLKRDSPRDIASPSTRQGAKQSHSIPFTKKRFILPIARLVNFFFTGLRLSDAHNGFRVFSRRAAGLIEISQDRMAHNSEIASQIKKHRLSFREIPVTVRYLEYGQGLGGGVKIIKDLILQKIFGI